MFSGYEEQGPAAAPSTSPYADLTSHTFLNWLNVFAPCALDQAMSTLCFTIVTNAQMTCLGDTKISVQMHTHSC